jgi:hypothetical protein
MMLKQVSECCNFKAHSDKLSFIVFIRKLLTIKIYVCLITQEKRLHPLGNDISADFMLTTADSSRISPAASLEESGSTSDEH